MVPPMKAEGQTAEDTLHDSERQDCHRKSKSVSERERS